MFCNDEQVRKLIRSILQTQFKPPYPPHIGDLVWQALVDDQAWRNYYFYLSDMKGRDVVDKNIHACIREMTGQGYQGKFKHLRHYVRSTTGYLKRIPERDPPKLRILTALGVMWGVLAVIIRRSRRP